MPPKRANAPKQRPKTRVLMRWKGSLMEFLVPSLFQRYLEARELVWPSYLEGQLISFKGFSIGWKYWKSQSVQCLFLILSSL